jgi:2-(1,2-epoxy-1,2-dihydrophenyl)acetyl-CoA isomerase
MTEPVSVTIEGGVGTISLNQPESRNALTPALRNALMDAVPQLAHDPAVRCVVLRGNGGHFMAGGDIKTMKTRLEATPAARTRNVTDGLGLLHNSIYLLRRMNKPVIASIRGAVAGFGIGMVGSCDLAIAADDAFFTLAYCHIGASPDGGSSFFVARTMGMKHAMELALLGDRFDAQRAKEIGLVNWVVPTAELDAETAKLATRLANGPTHAYANAKKLFNAAYESTMETQLQMEAELIADSMTTEDHAEGVAAFLAKRKPVFKGR